tara:strand:- start:293 stop:478 length:186 start_codon:yes stop_codon:yes gene_type:complete
MPMKKKKQHNHNCAFHHSPEVDMFKKKTEKKKKGLKMTDMFNMNKHKQQLKNIKGKNKKKY